VVKEILGRQQELFEYEYAIGDFFGETPILLVPRLWSRCGRNALPWRGWTQEFRSLIRDSKEASAMILQP